MAQEQVSRTRRWFVGSITLAFAGIAACFRRAPVTCVACGSSNHATSLCPVNNAAMAGSRDWFAWHDGRILFEVFDSAGNVSHYSAFPAEAYDRSKWTMDMGQQVIICGGNATVQDLAKASAILESRRKA